MVVARRRTTGTTKAAKPGSRLTGSAGRAAGVATRPVQTGRGIDVPAVEPEALVLTHWFDSGEGGEPYTATVRFTGRRVDTRRSPRPGDTFVQEETIPGIVPRTGPVSITTWVYGLQPGKWSVDSRLIESGPVAGRAGSARPRTSGGRRVGPARWSWRQWTVLDGPPGPVKTRWALLAPLARQPAVIPGLYTALAVLGIVLAMALQGAILARGNLTVGPALAASVLATVSGLIGAKLWYAVLHPDESVIKGGWAVDGFLVVAPLVAASALFVSGLPIGTVLDAVAPGIFFAVALGRIGCFLTGCCAGRCTASRWSIWSSDRRVGARRIPAQLLESAAGLVLAVVTLLLVLGRASPFGGAVFLVSFAMYALVRQGLLRVRAERRKSPRSLRLTAVAAGLAVVMVGALSLLQGT